MPQLSSYLPSILALGTLLIAAAVLTVARPQLRPEVRLSARFSAVAGLTILAQALHFIEELDSGFFVRFPEVFGLEPFSESTFVAFNVTWLGIWVGALLAVRAGMVIAVGPLWFLGLAMVLNLLAHPILALRVGGYFPGLWTALLVGVFGVLLLLELVKLTSTEAAI